MLALVVDTATPAVTAGVVRIEVVPPATAGSARIGATHVEVLATRITIDGKAHGELLSPSIRDCLAEAGLTPKDLQAVIAGLGPGPFTGLRVGLVTATAMGHALSIPTYGVCTLDALAYGTTGRLLVATDARRKEVYFAEYVDGQRTSGPSVDKPAAVTLQSDSEAMIGAGAHMYAEVLGLPVLPEPLYPPIAALAALAADRVRSAAPGEKLTPLYLRRPDAVPPGERK